MSSSEEWHLKITHFHFFLLNNVVPITWHGVLKQLKVRRACTITGPLTSDGAENFAATGSVEGCSVLPRHSWSGPACAWTHQRFNQYGISFSIWELTESGQSLTSNRLKGHNSRFYLEVISRSLFHKRILPQNSERMKSINQSIKFISNHIKKFDMQCTLYNIHGKLFYNKHVTTFSLSSL